MIEFGCTYHVVRLLEWEEGQKASVGGQQRMLNRQLLLKTRNQHFCPVPHATHNARPAVRERAPFSQSGKEA